MARLLLLLLLVLGLIGAGIAPAAAADCGRSSVDLTPLIDLGVDAYQGFSGGLYPEGSNDPPADYAEEGLIQADQIAPLSATGEPDPDGRIVLLSIGMSNTTQEFAAFKALADADPAKSPLVEIVDGAQGGQDAGAINDPDARFWGAVDQRLAKAGVTGEQVQVVWLKQAIAREDRTFPEDARGLQADLRTIVDILTERFPNLRIVYLSSRTYGGYATTTLNPEPYAYESGFAVKWLIEERIAGANAQRAPGPWLAWGPYLWTDGASGRSDGLVWTCDDVRGDGTHPSDSGRQKVADLLLTFFTTDETATGWFLA